MKTNKCDCSDMTTGITRHNGFHVYYASIFMNGKEYARRGKPKESLREVIGRLEVAVNKDSDHPIYLLNF
jgi:hypothetical protein